MKNEHQKVIGENQRIIRSLAVLSALLGAADAGLLCEPEKSAVLIFGESLLQSRRDAMFQRMGGRNEETKKALTDAIVAYADRYMNAGEWSNLLSLYTMAILAGQQPETYNIVRK